MSPIEPDPLPPQATATPGDSPPVPGALPDLPAGAYQTLIEQVPVGVFIPQAGKFRFINGKMAQLFGYTLDEMRSSVHPLDLHPPENRAQVMKMTKQRMAGQPSETNDIVYLRKDGSRFTGRASGARIDLGGEHAHLVTLQDVSEITEARRVAEQRAELLTHAEELAHIGSSELQLSTGRLTLSAGMFRILGEAPTGETVTPDWLLQRVPPEERAFVRSIVGGVRPDMPCEFEHRIQHADGSRHTVLHRAIAVPGPDGEAQRIVTILQDITAQRTAEQQLDRLARYDSVTGLPNRGALQEQLDDAVRQAARENRRIALLVIEIDQLAIVSESLGYAGADRLLARVGERLSAAMAPGDTLAHLGSGEYAAVLNRTDDVDEPRALEIALSLLAAFAEPLPLDDTLVKVSCGVGLSLFPRDSDSPEKLLHQAQAAMHRSRDLGENKICVYNPNTHAKAAKRLAMEAALTLALNRGEFDLHYQPQVDLTTGALIGVESLLRWNDPVRGSVSPEDFIPVAEETGLIVPIGEWVLRRACRQLRAWQDAGLRPLRVAVNLSVRQLEQPDLTRRIQAILLETQTDPRLLGMEITESLLMQESAHVGRTLHELRAMGMEISLDDFGTGYSNLNYLRRLPIDVVKVDRSFVHDVTAAPQDVSMTRAVITMAHSLQMKVLAEGVETEGQLSLLIANHCDQMQGYYFSPPVPAEGIAAMLAENKQLPAHLLQHAERKRTLLLVDDEDNIVAALKRLLRRDGYHLLTASSGAQGLQRLAEHPVDVIVSDQRMPGMTGVEFLRRAKELYPDTVRMVLSGYTELQSITDAVNEGAIYKFLTKPWDDERLRGHIEEAFRQKGMADENRRLGQAVMTANHELAQVNERLQHLLQTQRDQIDREETSRVIARDVLENIPAPVIGVDLDGMVAFVNVDAEKLFAHEPSLLGRCAEEALSPDLLKVWQLGDGAYHSVSVAGQAYRAVCRPISAASRSRGKLLVLSPGPANPLSH